MHPNKFKATFLKKIAGIAGMLAWKMGFFALHASSMPAMGICWHEQSGQNRLYRGFFSPSCHHARHASKFGCFSGLSATNWGGYTAQLEVIWHAVYPPKEA